MLAELVDYVIGADTHSAAVVNPFLLITRWYYSTRTPDWSPKLLTF